MELKTWLDLEYGRVTKLAKAIGVPPSFVSNMANRVKPVPIERCRQIEQYTESAVTCEEMRPDLVEEFAYMRTRPEPEMLGQVVLTAGCALGYDALNDVATKPELKAD